MKRLFLSLLVCLSALTLLTGCLALHFEGSKKSSTSNTTTNADERPVVSQTTTAPTLGQQLVDLQKAKDAGVITDAEYQAQKARLLENK
jgi:hypothetical protein